MMSPHRYGILGTLFGRKLMGLTKFLKRFPASIGQFLVGISGSKTVMAGDNIAFAHSDEFIAVSQVDHMRLKHVQTGLMSGRQIMPAVSHQRDSRCSQVESDLMRNVQYLFPSLRVH